MSSLAKPIPERQPLITPEQWEEMRKDCPTLRDEDHPWFERFVEEYRVLRQHPRKQVKQPRTNYRKIRNALQTTHNVENNSFERLQKITESGILFDALSRWIEPERYQPIRQAMKEELTGKQRLLGLYKNAIDLCDEVIIRTKAKGRGLKLNEPLYHLITNVSWFIRERTGNYLRRTTKDISLVYRLTRTVDKRPTDNQKKQIENAIDYLTKQNL
jgi:hypothetical protein